MRSPIRFVLGPVLGALVSLASCGSPPSSPMLSIDPTAPVTTDDLTLTIMENPDVSPGDGVVYQTAWFRDDQSVDSLADALVVPSAQTAKGQRWRAEVTPVDKKDRAGEVMEAEVTIENALPLATVTVAPSGPETTDAIVATASATDADGDTVTIRLTWLRDGTPTNLTGERVPAAQTASGEVWTVQAVANDGEDDSLVAEASVTIGNAAPIALLVTLSPASPSKADTIVATPNGTDPDDDSLTWTYAWTVDGVPVAGTTDSLTGDAFARGQLVKVAATPHDGSVAGNTVTAEATVVNAPPTVASATINPSVAGEGDTLSCVAAGWEDLDGDAESYVTTWAVGGMDLGEASMLTGASFDKGDAVTCTLTPWDGADEGPPVTSASITIANTAPTAPTVSLAPPAPLSSQDLVCTVTVPSADIDNDSFSYEFSWLRNGLAWMGATATTLYAGDTIAAASTAVGDTWQCQARATDGADFSASASSSTVTVQTFSPPVVGTVGTYGVLSGDGWKVCRADASTAWVAANENGKYNATSICQYFGYVGANAQGGTCGTVCGYCGTFGQENYDGGGGSLSNLGNTVHWRCYR